MFTMQSLDMKFLSFLLLLSGISTKLSLAAAERQNSSIYESLRRIAETDYFSKIEIGLNGSCPRMTSKCSATSCAISKTTLEDGSGRIDLLKTREAYSSTAAKGSAEVWADLYSIVGDDAQLASILSGLRFSISTHIAAFHTKMFGRYFSYPGLFKKRFNRVYKENFLVLYAILRTAVASLINNPTEINSEVIKLSRKIVEDNEAVAKERVGNYNQDSFSLVSGISEMTNIDEIYIDPAYIDTIAELLKPLACLSCSKCLLWGTIQIRGLRAAVKAINNIPLTKLDLICLINGFRRVSVTMEESRRLEETKLTFLWLPIIFHYEITLITCSVLSIWLVYLRMRKNKPL